MRRRWKPASLLQDIRPVPLPDWLASIATSEHDRIAWGNVPLRASIPYVMHVMRLSPYPNGAGVFVTTKADKVDYGAHFMAVRTQQARAAGHGDENRIGR